MGGVDDMRLKERRTGSAGLVSLVALCLLLFAPAARGQAGELKPLQKENFIHSLEDGGKRRPRETARTYIKLVEKYGVAFKLTQADEARIRRAGGYLPAEEIELLLTALRDNFRPGPSAVLTELVEHNTSLLNLVKTTVEESKALKERAYTAEGREKLLALRDALTKFSGAVQDTLYNGSQPALQMLINGLESDYPPNNMAAFYDAITMLDEASERQAAELSQVASTFVLDPGYGALAKAIRQRATLFKQMRRFQGKPTRAQAAEMRKALDLWQQINTELENAVGQLNEFILELKP
jgi:hypothetical protein